MRMFPVHAVVLGFIVALAAIPREATNGQSSVHTGSNKSTLPPKDQRYLRDLETVRANERRKSGPAGVVSKIPIAVKQLFELDSDNDGKRAKGKGGRMSRQTKNNSRFLFCRWIQLFPSQ